MSTPEIRNLVCTRCPNRDFQNPEELLEHDTHELDLDDIDESKEDTGIIATDGGWINENRTEWCASCQRFRMNCSHLTGASQ